MERRKYTRRRQCTPAALSRFRFLGHNGPRIIRRRRKLALAETETYLRSTLEVVSHQKDALTIFHQPINY